MDSNNMYNQNNTQQYSSYYENPSQPQVQMPMGQNWEEPVSMGEWLVSMLLMCIQGSSDYGKYQRRAQYHYVGYDDRRDSKRSVRDRLFAECIRECDGNRV